ncbi:MAG TPA: sorbitol dehydrogenase [Nitrospirae bacterium]|nr:sorbitol dehydrogenase [Nitrospirota bacterium]
MRVVKLYSFDDIRVEDMPVPDIGAGDALVRVRSCGICSGDVMPWYIEKKAPLVLGHEPAGEIVKLGRGLEAKKIRGSEGKHINFSTSQPRNFFKKGDRVFFHHHAPCFNCAYCKRGDHVQCSTWRGSRIIPGGISEYALVPEVNLRGDTLLLPEKISFDHATLVEPVACVVKGLKRAGMKHGDTVLVMGLGVMGQIHIMLAKKYGAKVIGADKVPFRLEKAMEFGADSVIDISREDLADAVSRLTDGGMADIVVVGPGDIKAMSQGIGCAARAGKVLFFTPAGPDDILQLRPHDIYFRDINIITSYSCGPDDTKAALDLISEGSVDAQRLITHRFPLEKASEAFRLTAKAEDSLKVVVIF